MERLGVGDGVYLVMPAVEYKRGHSQPAGKAQTVEEPGIPGSRNGDIVYGFEELGVVAQLFVHILVVDQSQRSEYSNQRDPKILAHDQPIQEPHDPEGLPEESSYKGHLPGTHPWAQQDQRLDSGVLKSRRQCCASAAAQTEQHEGFGFHLVCDVEDILRPVTDVDVSTGALALSVACHIKGQGEIPSGG